MLNEKSANFFWRAGVLKLALDFSADSDQYDVFWGRLQIDTRQLKGCEALYRTSPLSLLLHNLMLAF